VQLLNQRSKPQCMLYAGAMLLDEDPETLISEIGHDGLERVWKDLHMPACLRGFHIQELLDCCMRRGLGLMLVELLPRSGAQGSTLWRKVFPTDNMAQTRFSAAIQGRPGIFVGKAASGGNHAVAWDGENIYDPNGRIYGVDEFHFKEAWLLVKLL